MSTHNQLIDGLIGKEVLHTKRIIAAFREIPRGDFIPSEYAAGAYNDSPVALTSFGFNVSAPHMYAICLEALNIQPGHRFLDIGSGCGLLTCLGGYLASPGGSALGIDVLDNALNLAKKSLQATQKKGICRNVSFERRNCFVPDPKNRKFDRIHCGASCLPQLLNTLGEMLLPGGMLVAPSADKLWKLEKDSQGNLNATSICGVRYGELVMPTAAELEAIPPKEPKPEPKLVEMAVRYQEKRKVHKLPSDSIESLRQYLASNLQIDDPLSISVEYYSKKFEDYVVLEAITDLPENPKLNVKVEERKVTKPGKVNFPAGSGSKQSNPYALRLADMQTINNENPIFGVASAPLLSLKDCILYAQKNSPELKAIYLDGAVSIATEKGQAMFAGNEHKLTAEELAAIHLYTQATPFYKLLNAQLRSANRVDLKPYFPYLKLIMGGLAKLPSIPQTVYRGVPENFGDFFKPNLSLIWWSFTSTAAKAEVLQTFVQGSDTSTMFHINCFKGKDISAYSANTSENEILLAPGSKFLVESKLTLAGVVVVQMKQILQPGLVDFEV